MKDKFVYLVECSSGRWDSYDWWISGIFEKQEDAEKHAKELNEESNRLKETEDPIKKQFEDMTDEELTEHMKWWTDKDNAMDFNGAVVKQYPVNKPNTK